MRRILLLPLALLCGCRNLPNTSSGARTTQLVQMKFIGTAVAGQNDPINGCRVYGFQMDGYTQTAVLCSGHVTVASNHHQNSDETDVSDE